MLERAACPPKGVRLLWEAASGQPAGIEGGARRAPSVAALEVVGRGELKARLRVLALGAPRIHHTNNQ